MALKELLGKAFGRDERFKEAQQELSIQKKLEERQKSSNERELEQFQKEERERGIKVALEQFREKQKKEFFESGMFNQKSIMKNDNPILKQKNIFKTTKQKKQRSMFIR